MSYRNTLTTLEGEIADLEQAFKWYREIYLREHERAEKLKLRNVKLREALEKISNRAWVHSQPDSAVTEARNALKEDW